MRVAAALFAGGALLTLFQGAAAAFVPARFVPDLAFLWVLALGLCWRSAGGGLSIAAALGFLADLLSNSLFGQHALLRLVAFGAARVGSRSLNLRGPLPQAVFAGALTVVNAAAFGALTAFFTPGSDVPWLVWRDLGPQIPINALFAPIVAAAAARVVRMVGDDDSGRRLVLEPRNRTA